MGSGLIGDDSGLFLSGQMPDPSTERGMMMKVTVHLEGSVPRLGAVLRALAVCSVLVCMQFAANSALTNHVAMLGVGLVSGHLLATSDARQRS